jgi:flagellar FliL protein
MAKEEKEEIVQEQPEKKKGSLWKIIIMAVVALAVIGAGVFGGWYYFTHSGEPKKPAAAAPKPLIGALWSLDPFIVNLADNQGERYLKLVMQLEVADPTVSAELEQLKPKLRDNILDLLTAKTYNELMEGGGKQKLREEIVSRLSSFVAKGKIVRVYFTEFVIQ